MNEDWRNTFEILMYASEQSRGGWGKGVAPKGPKSIFTNIVMLHIKSKIKKK